MMNINNKKWLLLVLIAAKLEYCTFTSILVPLAFTKL